MKLEDQVVSLELAQRLKKLGVKQDAWFSWCLVSDLDLISEEQANGKNWRLDKHDGALGMTVLHKSVSAFTVAELGEMLPFNIKTNKIGDSGKWFARHFIGPNHQSGDGIIADTEADARGRMLIHLIEQGLIKANEVTRGAERQ